jgi:hypothetical protein
MQGKNYEIKIANRCFENVAQFRFLGMTTKLKSYSGGN